MLTCIDAEAPMLFSLGAELAFSELRDSEP